MKRKLISLILVLALLFTAAGQMTSTQPAGAATYRSPYDLAYSPDGTLLAVSDSTAAQLVLIDPSTGAVIRTVTLNGEPRGVAWASNTRVYVAEYGAGTVAEIDPSNGNILRRFTVGLTPAGVAVAKTSQLLLVTDKGLNKVYMVNLSTGEIAAQVGVVYAPESISIKSDESISVVANTTPGGDARSTSYAGAVSIIDLSTKTLTANVTLPQGSSNLKGIKVSNDGKYAFVVHTLGRVNVVTSQLSKGWTATNALSLIDLTNNSLYATVLLDGIDQGAANPWGIVQSADGNTLWISISGTHQVAKIDLAGVLSKMSSVNVTTGGTASDNGATNTTGEDETKAFDGLTSTKWLVKSTTGVIQYDFAGTTAYTVNKYTVASANDVPGRDPKNWQFQGSNDGSAWVTLDTRSNETFANRMQTKTYTLTNTTPYQMYRLNITANSGDVYLQLSDIQLFATDGPGLSTLRAGLKNSLTFLRGSGLLQTIQLPGQGPRGIDLYGTKLAVASYFAGKVYFVDIGSLAVTETAVGTIPAEDPIRRGERLWNDGTHTFESWLSCATCHPDARQDGLNWDLMNDGNGNPKNAKSMLYVSETPPVMWSGIRTDYTVGINSGFLYIEYNQGTQDEKDAIAAYLRSLRPSPNPYLSNGSMTADALAGKALFESAETGCATCHTGTYLTDLTAHNVGTGHQLDTGVHDPVYYTPPLRELWRSAPYLHDGSAATLRDVLTTQNAGDLHGKTSQLTSTQLDQLVAYMQQIDGQFTVTQNYYVTYSGNGSTGGSVPTDSGAYIQGDTVTVQNNTGNLTKTGYIFDGWNTQSDGNGTNYAPGSTVIVGTDNVTLYAKWKAWSNVALNKTVTASSISNGLEAANSVDGNTTTRWSSNYTSDEWIYVDLGSTYSVSSVKLNWEAAYATGYKLQVSGDAVNWTDVYTTTTGDGGIDDITFTATNARYVRMLGVTRALTKYGYSLYEFEVYGTAVTLTDVSVGGTASDNGAANPANEDETKAFDKLTSTKWLVYTTTGAIQYDFAGTTANKVIQYVVASANDVPGRDPKNWELQGSNDGVAWTTVDTQTNQTFAGRLQANTYNISNNTAYHMYRLNITANNGDTLLQLSELQLLAQT